MTTYENPGNPQRYFYTLMLRQPLRLNKAAQGGVYILTNCVFFKRTLCECCMGVLRVREQIRRSMTTSSRWGKDNNNDLLLWHTSLLKHKGFAPLWVSLQSFHCTYTESFYGKTSCLAKRNVRNIYILHVNRIFRRTIQLACINLERNKRKRDVKPETFQSYRFTQTSWKAIVGKHAPLELAEDLLDCPFLKPSISKQYSAASLQRHLYVRRSCTAFL